jgi:hypothetical protein
VNVLGVGAPVWPGRDVEEKFIVVLLAAIAIQIRPNEAVLEFSARRARQRGSMSSKKHMCSCSATTH